MPYPHLPNHTRDAQGAASGKKLSLVKLGLLER